MSDISFDKLKSLVGTVYSSDLLRVRRRSFAAVLQEEMAMAAASRRMSVAPVNRAASNIRNMSGRHGSMFYGRSTFMEGIVFSNRWCRSVELYPGDALRKLVQKTCASFLRQVLMQVYASSCTNLYCRLELRSNMPSSISNFMCTVTFWRRYLTEVHVLAYFSGPGTARYS